MRTDNKTKESIFLNFKLQVMENYDLSEKEFNETTLYKFFNRDYEYFSARFLDYMIQLSDLYMEMKYIDKKPDESINIYMASCPFQQVEPNKNKEE